MTTPRIIPEERAEWRLRYALDRTDLYYAQRVRALDALEAAEARAEKAERERQRSHETRRKILVGAAVLAEIEAEPSARGVVQDILRRRLTQERDRALFPDLLP